MCGSPVEVSKSKKIYVDGAELTVCQTCGAKLLAKAVKQEALQQKNQGIQRSSSSIGRVLQYSSTTRQSPSQKGVQTSQSTKPIKTSVDEKLELIEDFAEKIRRAREAVGWDQKTLALKLKVSENIIKRIESGKLRPPIDLARRIEEILNVKILVPAVDDMVSSKGKVEKYVTFGEIVSIRGGEED
jgi:putative transcription factor